MFCKNCGTQNKDDAAFCINCGSPLSAQPAQTAPQSGAPQAPVANQASASAAQPAESTVGAAWKDISMSPGWLKRTLLLCLIGVVPILNFAVDGYCIRWGSELASGKREFMPVRVFKKREIATGFFAMLINFALYFALMLVVFAGTWFISAIFNIFSPTAAVIVGFLISFVVCIFVLVFFQPFIDACVMRMSVVGFLESGFNCKQVVANFRKGMGSLIGASLLPRIIVTVISLIIIGILIALTIGMVQFAADSLSSMSYYDSPMYYLTRGYSYSGMMSVAGTAANIFFFMMLVIYVVFAMLQVFQKLLMYRAVGHWSARYASEWAEETEDGVQV